MSAVSTMPPIESAPKKKKKKDKKDKDKNNASNIAPQQDPTPKKSKNVSILPTPSPVPQHFQATLPQRVLTAPKALPTQAVPDPSTAVNTKGVVSSMAQPPGRNPNSSWTTTNGQQMQTDETHLSRPHPRASPAPSVEDPISGRTRKANKPPIARRIAADHEAERVKKFNQKEKGKRRQLARQAGAGDEDRARSFRAMHPKMKIGDTLTRSELIKLRRKVPGNIPKKPKKKQVPKEK